MKHLTIASVVLLLISSFISPVSAQEFKRYNYSKPQKTTVRYNQSVNKGGGMRHKAGYRIRGSRNYGKRTTHRSDTIKFTGRGR